MAAKRKGGLKLNAICAKLSRQVVYDGAAEQAEVGPKPPESLHGDGPPHGEQEGEAESIDGLQDVQRLEEDKKRREAIEKWVNGEYTDEHGEERLVKSADGNFLSTEGVYMLQPKGCSEEEDVDGAQESLDGSFVDDRDSEEVGPKEEGDNSSSEASIRQHSIASSGEPQKQPAHSGLLIYIPLLDFRDTAWKLGPTAEGFSETQRLLST